MNIVDRTNINAMNITATAFGDEVNELEKAGLTMVQSSTVRSPMNSDSSSVL